MGSFIPWKHESLAIVHLDIIPATGTEETSDP